MSKRDFTKVIEVLKAIGGLAFLLMFPTAAVELWVWQPWVLKVFGTEVVTFGLCVTMVWALES